MLSRTALSKPCSVTEGMRSQAAAEAEPEYEIPEELLPLKAALDSAQLGVQNATSTRELFEEKVSSWPAA